MVITPKSSSGQSGFTLLEALIAILVLSFGLLGVASMQLKAMQSAHLSYHRSIATLAAQDAVERLWAGLAANAGECPDASLVNGNNNEWFEAWEPHLPELSETPVTASGCEYIVVVSWRDNRFLDDNDDVVDVSTLVYVIKLPGVEP